MTSITRLRLWLTVGVIAALLVACSTTSSDRRGRQGTSNPSDIIQRMDKDGDGALSRDEIPNQRQRLKESFDIIDADGNGRITAAELSAVSQRRGQAGGGGGQTPPPTPPATGAPTTDSGWRTDARPIGRAGSDYIDPEVLSSENLIAWQDKAGTIWAGQVDPATGMFRTAGGHDYRFASDAVRVGETYNGPEFGLDSTGWAVYFTKMHDGVPQIGRGRLVDARPVSEALTTGSQRRQSVLASKDSRSPETALIYLQGRIGSGDFYGSDTTRVRQERRIMALSGVDSPRFIDGTTNFVFSETRGEAAGQLKLFDRSTGETKQITADAGTKAWAYGWRAPDFGNDLLVLALIDRKALGVWRDTGGTYWERVATLGPPPGSRLTYMGSPEPVVSEGRSFVSLVLKDKRGTPTDSEVWVLGIDPGASGSFARRVDSRERGLARSDPETYRGAEEIFLIYNVITSRNGYEIHRARTGLSASP